MEPIFSVLLFLGTFAMSQLHATDTKPVSESVQGASTTPVPTSTPSPSPSPTPIQVVVKKVVQLSPTPQKREIGAWYWRQDLARSQRWLGTDKDGKDIWTDSGDPTPTPTPKPAEHRGSYGSSFSTQVSVQSYQKEVKTVGVQNQVVVKKN